LLETTARVLSATLGLLALYAKEQDVSLEQIREVLSDNRDPVLAVLFHHPNQCLCLIYQVMEDMGSLGKVLACFHEGASMFRECRNIR
jgi:hypothetical protein